MILCSWEFVELPFLHKHHFYIQSFYASSFHCFFVFMDWRRDNKCILDKQGGKMAGLFKELVYVLTAASQCIAELMQAHTS